MGNLCDVLLQVYSPQFFIECSVLEASVTDPHEMIFLPEPSSYLTVSASNR